MTNKRYITQEMMSTAVLDIVSQMYSDEWRPDYIVGVTRGGLIPAVMMSHYTGIKMHTLDVRLRDGDEHESNLPAETRKVHGKQLCADLR